MPGPWDNSLKRLISETPQDFVSWLMAGAKFKQELSPHLKARNIDADTLYEIEIEGNPCLLHIEFQATGRKEMAQRAWEYNVLATCAKKLPIYTFIVYLKKQGTIVSSPYTWLSHDGSELHRFQFGVVKLWEIPTATLKNLGLRGMLPLLPLTREGKSLEVVDEVISELCRKDKPERELLLLAYGLATLVFKKEDDQDWLKGRFGMLLDELMSESWGFQEIMQRGMEKGEKEGEAKAKKEIAERMSQDILVLVETRFVSLLEQAKRKIAAIEELDVLQNLFLKLSLAVDEDEARESLK